MIRSLRQRHRFFFSALAVLLPLAFAVALSARKPPLRNVPPPPLQSGAFTLPRVLFESEALWPGRKIITRVYADTLPASQLALELQPMEDLNAPDILVYWSPKISDKEIEQLQEAYFLGVLAGKQKRRWPLPEVVLQSHGKLILYSLGHQAVLASTFLQIEPGGQKP